MREDVIFRLVRGGRFGEPPCQDQNQLDPSQSGLKPVSGHLMRYACRLAETLDSAGHFCKLLDNRNDVLMEVMVDGVSEARLLIRLRDSRAGFRRFGERYYLCASVEDLDGKPIDVQKQPTERAIRYIEDRLNHLSWEPFSFNDYRFDWLPKQMRIETSQHIPMYYSDGRIEAYLKHIADLKSKMLRLAWQPASPLKALREEITVLCDGIDVSQGTSGTSYSNGLQREKPRGDIDLLKYAIAFIFMLEQSLGFECAIEFSSGWSSRLYIHIIDRTREVKIAAGVEPFDHVVVLLDIKNEWEADFLSSHRHLILGAVNDFEGCPLDLDEGPDDDIVRYLNSWMDDALKKRQEIFLP